MADVKISALGAISVVAGEDLVAIIDDPSGTPASRKATITQLATFINTGAITAGSTTTFTAKTIDADNNTLSNIELDNLKSGVLDTDLSSVSGSDDTIASAKAVKAYVDAQILTEDTISELNDTTITSVGDNELLQYDSSSSKWINQTIAEAGLSPVAGSSSIVTTGTIGTGTWQGTAIASAYIAGDAIVGTKIADNAIDSEHYTDGSIDLAHMSVNSIDSDQYVDASIDLAHLSADSVNGTKIADDSINSEHIVDGSVDLAHLSVNSVDSDQYVDGSIDLAHMSVNSIDSDQYVDGSIDLAHLSADCVNGTKIADNAIDSEHYTDGSIDLEHISTSAKTESFIISLSDEETDLTTGTNKAIFQMPYAFTITDIRATAGTSPVGATKLTVDINKDGSTILTTKLTFDASENTTTSAQIPHVIASGDTAFADGAIVAFDIDAVGNSTAGKGLKVYLIGYQT